MCTFTHRSMEVAPNVLPYNPIKTMPLCYPTSLVMTNMSYERRFGSQAAQFDGTQWPAEVKLSSISHHVTIP